MYMCAHSACRKAERRYGRRDRCDGDCVGGEQTLEFPIRRSACAGVMRRWWPTIGSAPFNRRFTASLIGSTQRSTAPSLRASRGA